jgi:3-methylcrotonyl-CoA carboxylase alpha subunit
MRVVASADDFAAALEAARREAASSFGDDRVILERFLPHARHVEVQLFADAAGRVEHLFDRDCSAQRRRQKLVEEAPAPGLSDALREGMREAAIACAKAVAYVGAGTVEFLVADDQFYFMEMNTRLQVEHPVTEAITGLDLVEWQIRVARGEPLPLDQQAIVARGHAIEARLCAEDPALGFLPQAGTLARLRWPQPADGVRIDTGVREGDAVAPQYDSLLAKVVAHGADRREALDRLAAALKRTEIAGVVNNKAFLARVLAHPDFVAGAFDTGLVERRLDEFTRPQEAPSLNIVLAAAFAALRRMEGAATPPPDPADPFSPWRSAQGWRLGGRATLDLRLVHEDREIPVSATWRDDGYAFVVAEERRIVTGGDDGQGGLALRAGDEILRPAVVFDGDRLTIILAGADYVFRLVDPRRADPQEPESRGSLSSPLPGSVIAVMADVGAVVEKGAPLVVIEAMKMEHTVCAPRAGRIEAVRVSAGETVAAGAELVVMEAAS